MSQGYCDRFLLTGMKPSLQWCDPGTGYHYCPWQLTTKRWVKYLDNISDQDILELQYPTGIPLVYELDDDLKLFEITTWVTKWKLKSQEAVANQGKAKHSEVTRTYDFFPAKTTIENNPCISVSISAKDF